MGLHGDQQPHPQLPKLVKKQKDGKGSLLASERKEKGKGGMIEEAVLKDSNGLERKRERARQTPVNSPPRPGALVLTDLVDSEDEGGS